MKRSQRLVISLSTESFHVLGENLPSGPWSTLTLAIVSAVKAMGMRMNDNLLLKVENHAELSLISANSLDEFFFIFNAWHLANAEGVVFLEDLSDLLQVLVTAGTTGVVFVSLENSSV